jgi:hypothetical protein
LSIFSPIGENLPPTRFLFFFIPFIPPALGIPVIWNFLESGEAKPGFCNGQEHVEKKAIAPFF